MRPSDYRHTLAIMRRAAGLGQKELADAVGCSTSTIQSVELGRLKLSDELAMKVSHSTGIDLAWLLKNDLNAPPVATSGNPYHRQHFEMYQSAKGSTLDGDSVEHMPDYLLGYYTRLRGIFACAAQKGEFQYRLAYYKLDRAIDALRKEFGSVAAFDEGKDGPSLATYQMFLIEHDVQGAREHFEKSGIELDPVPTEESMKTHRKLRYKHELPPRKDRMEKYQRPTAIERGAIRQRAVAETNAQLLRDGLIKPPASQPSSDTPPAKARPKSKTPS